MTTFRKTPAWAIRAGLALTVLAALVVGIATLTPVPPGDPPLPHLDKVMHFLGFFGVTLPAALVLPHRAWVFAALAAVFGGSIELIQPSVGRSAEWGDFAANAAGAAFAAWLARWLHPLVHPHLERWFGGRG